MENLYNNSFNNWIDKKRHSTNERIFSEPKSSGRRVKVELDLSNYATKADLKNATRVDTSKFTIKIDLASLKSNIDKLDIDKLKNLTTILNNLKSKVDKLDVNKLVLVRVDLSKLSDVLKNYVIKKVYIMLRSKILKKNYLILLI